MKNKKIFTLSSLALATLLFSCGGGATSSEVVKPNLETKKLFIVGDSTACSFNDATYYYPRYGFGTQMGNYFYEELQIVNLALSGRSSKSFLVESEYNTLKNSISSGDYLLIAFGHNDEKGDDAARFTDARLDITDPSSFKYSLYENYIKLAQDKGATPLLSTPIVRLHPSGDYAGSSGHVTEYGDYAQAIRDLGVEKDVSVIDLTKVTKDLYTEEGYDVAQYYHAMTAGKKEGEEVVADTSSVDKTHLNVYGAKKVAYLFANELKNSTNPLKEYVDASKLVSPTKENDLVSNPSYVYSDYTPFDGSSYSPAGNFSTISEGWYGTAFGDLGGEPTSSNGFYAKETTEGVFTVGQNKMSEGTNYKGKISSSTEGYSFLFRQVEASKNFTLSASARVTHTENQKQAGFGLMIRDDCYVPTRNAGILSNYIASGLLCDESSMNVHFARQSTVLSKGNDKVSGLYAVDDTAELTITRLGQKVSISLTYKDQTYTKEYLDFPLQEKDTQYMYIGMFATRGTIIEYTNVNFAITGDAIEA